MKNVIISLSFIFISTLCFSQGKIFQEVSITGNRVNIRTEPNLTCEIAYQRDRGDTFQGARYNDDWYELIDENNNILYGYYKYVKIVEKAPVVQEVLSSTIPTTSNPSIPSSTNVVSSVPLVLYQSETYTLASKPTHIPELTIKNQVKTTVSASKSIVKNQASEQKTETGPKAILVADKSTNTKVDSYKTEKIVEANSVEKTVVKQKTVALENTTKKVEAPKAKTVEKTMVEQEAITMKSAAKTVEAVPKAKIVEKALVEKKTEMTNTTAPKAAIENELPEAKEVTLLIEQLEAYIELKNRQEARNTALALINNHVDESLEAEDGICILVGEKAYSSFFDMLPDNDSRIRELKSMLNDVLDPLVINLIRLDIVDDWIQKEEYQYALDIMDNTMAHNSESLTLPKHCENNPNLKSSPQIELKNKYFLLYHLLNDDKKKEILANLKGLTKAKNLITQNIAKDIYGKLSGDFWEKN